MNIILWITPILLVWWVHGWCQRKKIFRIEHELYTSHADHEALKQRFQRRSERLDALFSTINEAVIRLDRQGNVLAFNAQAGHVFHIHDSLQLPHPMSLLYRNPEWNTALAQGLAQLPSASVLPDIQIQDDIQAARLTSLNGNQALLLCLDISRQRNMEIQRAQLMHDLMHDLKTPLTSILGYARSIEQFGDNKKIRHEAAETIATEAKRLNHLLESLLTLDQIGNTQAQQEDEPADIGSIIHTVLARFSHQLEQQHVRMEVAVPKHLPPITVSAEHIDRMVSNLIENVLQHAFDEKGGCLQVIAHQDEGKVCLKMQDDGCGVDAAALPRLAERFYRVESSRKGAGHGLGLSIVHELIQACQGEIDITSQAGEGLCIKLCLPVAQQN